VYLNVFAFVVIFAIFFINPCMFDFHLHASGQWTVGSWLATQAKNTTWLNSTTHTHTFTQTQSQPTKWTFNVLDCPEPNWNSLSWLTGYTRCVVITCR